MGELICTAPAVLVGGGAPSSSDQALLALPQGDTYTSSTGAAVCLSAAATATTEYILQPISCSRTVAYLAVLTDPNLPLA